MMSPDEHFILDRHPFMRGVYFLAGLSGHGFKFAPVLGEALANFALDRGQEIEVKFFSLKRF
jgi:glycine/D-amino acid oxidase-like deaminating enzyme